MDSGTTLFILFLLAGCGLFFFSVVFIALAGFFIISKSTSSKAYSETIILKDEDYLASATLRPWSPNAWTDMSSHWDGWWSGFDGLGKSEAYAHGTITSSQDPTGPGWMAFTIHRQELRNAEIVLKTSQQRLELKITSKHIWDQNIRGSALIDGLENGSIEVNYPACIYRDNNGAVATGWNVKLRSFRPNTFKWTIHYDPIAGNGRAVASIIDTWYRTSQFKDIKPYPPALHLTGAITPTEQNILLAGIALCLYYESLAHRDNVNITMA